MLWWCYLRRAWWGGGGGRNLTGDGGWRNLGDSGGGSDGRGGWRGDMIVGGEVIVLLVVQSRRVSEFGIGDANTVRHHLMGWVNFGFFVDSFPGQPTQPAPCKQRTTEMASIGTTLDQAAKSRMLQQLRELSLQNQLTIHDQIAGRSKVENRN